MTTAGGHCPKCGNVLLGGGDVVAWCPGCNWNVDPSPPSPPRSRLGRWWLARQNALALRLYNDVARQKTARGGGLGIRLAVLATAGAVHLVTLALLAACVLIVIADAPVSVKVFLLFLVGGLLWTVQPVFIKRRLPAGVRLDRSGAPALFSLLDEVAASVGAKPVDRVVVSARYNAAYWKDRRRHPVVEIGIPLWVVLSPQERVGVLAHEFGHRVNGDLRNGVAVDLALVTISRWLYLLRPAVSVRGYTRRTSNQSLVALAESVLPLVLAPLTLLIGFFGTSLNLLGQRQGQRAEYLADEIGARVAGSEGAKGMLTKLVLGEHLQQELMRVVRFRRTANPWQALLGYLETFPDAERERVMRVAKLRLARIDSTHPPSSFRLNLVAARPQLPPQVVGDSARMAAIDAELDAGAKAAANRLRDLVGN